MKKLVSLVLCGALTATMLLTASCGKKKEKVDLTSVTKIAELKGAKIAAQAGTFHADALKQIDGVDGIEYEDFDTMLVALNSGAIDGYIAEEPTAIDVCGKNEGLDYLHFVNNDTGFKATTADTAIAVGCKTGSELVAKINAVLAKITDDQKAALMNAMVSINAGKTVADIESLTGITESIETTGTLKVAMECAYAPFNWTQTSSDNGAVPISSAGGEGLYANGYDVQIAKIIAAALGLKLEIYAEKWESLVAGVQAGTYDAIIAGMSPTADREEEIDFSDPYYISNLVVIYKK